MNLLKCVKVLFTKKGLSKNVGFYIYSAIIIFHVIILIIFYDKKFNLIKNKIKLLTIAIKYFKPKKSDKKYKNGDIIEKEVKNKKEKKIRFNEFKDNNINSDINNTDNIINEPVKEDKKIKIKKKNIKKRNKINKKEKQANTNTKDNIININLNISYYEALNNDKRSYWIYYTSLIKTKHEFINAFIFNKDYNSKIIKIDLFIFGFSLNYAVNGLFFNDDTMHNVYENEGLFDISYQLPLIIYSSFISMFLGSLVQMLGSSNDAISDFKLSKNIKNVDKRAKNLIKTLKKNYIFYFILSFLLLFSFWYYISVFDAVYINTQFLLLEDTLIGFAFSMVTPFILYLIPGIFRIPALSTTHGNRRCLYAFSKFLAIL